MSHENENEKFYQCVFNCLKNTVGVSAGAGVVVGMLAVIGVGITAGSGPAAPVTAAVIVAIILGIVGAFLLAWAVLAAACIVFNCYEDEQEESESETTVRVSFELVVRFSVVGIYGVTMYRSLDMLKFFG